MGGYEQSKWVAERLVEEAIERRLVAVGSSVMRLGMVGWHNVSGLHKFFRLFCLFLLSISFVSLMKVNRSGKSKRLAFVFVLWNNATRQISRL